MFTYKNASRLFKPLRMQARGDAFVDHLRVCEATFRKNPAIAFIAFQWFYFERILLYKSLHNSPSSIPNISTGAQHAIVHVVRCLIFWPRTATPQLARGGVCARSMLAAVFRGKFPLCRAGRVCMAPSYPCLSTA